MLTDLTEKQRALADFISNISEEGYAAGWMANLEFAVWDAVVNGERMYGRTKIGQTEIDQLQRLSQECNCWIYYDDEKEETAINLGQWIYTSNKAVEENPDIVRS